MVPRQIGEKSKKVPFSLSISWCSLRLLIVDECHRWNNISLAGAQSFGIALKYDRCRLTVLDLGHNKLGNGGATVLGRALPKNTNLRVLSVNNAYIGDEGGAALAQGLTENQHIEEFNCAGTTLDGTAPEPLGPQADCR